MRPDQDEAQVRGRVEEALGKDPGGRRFCRDGQGVRGQPLRVGGRLPDGAPRRAGARDRGGRVRSAAGGHSEPIRTAAGFHLIKVEKVRAEPVAPLAEVREAIREQIFQEKYEAKRKEYVASLRQRPSRCSLKEGEILGGSQAARDDRPRAAAAIAGRRKYVPRGFLSFCMLVNI